MPRTRGFDRAQALDQAMQLFWRYGYEGTSMQALVEAMGINRSSLYATFGSKRALYRAALDRYAQRGQRFIDELMARDLPVREAFRQLLQVTVDNGLSDPLRRGCFLLNATADQAPLDPTTARDVLAIHDEMTGFFEQALARAHRAGELSPHHDPRRLARYFLNVFNGLRITIKATTDRAYLQDIVEASLTVFD